MDMLVSDSVTLSRLNTISNFPSGLRIAIIPILITYLLLYLPCYWNLEQHDCAKKKLAGR